MRLDLGAGERSPDGFTPLGNINGTEIYPLPYPDGVATDIRASHVLEHFPHQEVPKVIREWTRVLAPGGTLKIAVPDFAAIAERYLAGENQPTEGYIMGGQIDGADYHKALFDDARLKQLLAVEGGLVLLRSWKSELDDCASLPISLNLQGTKPRQPQPKIIGVMSTPRLGFNDMWQCAVIALPKLGIDFRSINGAFWDQCLTHAIDDALKHADLGYVLTLDYDSVFHAGHVSKLIQLAMVYPDADAIAPVQASRHGENPLFGLPEEAVEKLSGNEVKIDRAALEVDLLPVKHAHFGLTLIRADKLRSLSRPWFHGQPNSEGHWEDGKTDADIFFWRKWEREGRTLHIAPQVTIGHIELMIRWPSEDLRPMWQAAKDWEATRSAPEGVWTGK